MSKNPISIYDILKHRRLSAVKEDVSENISNIKSAFDSIHGDMNTSIFDRKFDELISLVSNTSESANRSYNYPLLALEKSEYKEKPKYIQLYCENVVPRLNTDSLTNLNDTIDQYSLGDEVKEKIKGVIETNLIADRICNNHNNLNERCDDISNTILRSYRLGEHTVAEQVKGYVDTYKLRPYQKMNLCLEEIFYVLESNSCKYDKSSMVKAVVETFLLSGYDENRENYIKVLENNYCFNEEDTQDAMNLLQNTDAAITGTIKSVIDEYMRVGNIPFVDLCTNIGGCSINDLKLNIGSGLDFMWRCANNGQISYEEMNEGIVALFNSMANKIATDEKLMSIEDMKEICVAIQKYILDTANKAKSDLYVTDDDKTKIGSFLNTINLGREQFIKDCSYLYSRNNIDTVYQLNQEAATVVPLQEFKKFRFTNLIKAAINLDKYIKAKAKSVFTNNKFKRQSKSKKLHLKGIALTTKSGASILFGENTELESFIGSDHKPDITVCQFYYDEACELECKDFFDDVCKEFNQTIKDPDMRAYYIFNPGIGEVHLKENVCISLTEEEQKLVDEAYDPAEDIYMECITKFDGMSEKLIGLNDLTDRIVDQKAIITNEQFEMLVEALQYLNVSKKDVKAFVERYTEYRYRTLVSENAESVFNEEAATIDHILESYTPEEGFVPFDIQMEAVDLICDILEAGIKKPNIKKAEIKKANANHQDDEDDEDYEDDDEDEDNDNKEESPEKKAQEKKEIEDEFDPRGGEKKKGFGKIINNLKLGLKGLRAKFGDLSAKEQEASKNLDASANHLMKSIKGALISDRREAIIKGSVIPSFSRCLKAGIGLAAGGALSLLLFHNIIPVIIGAIGAFAVSKKLTQRERLLLLDDIETELDVVDKEIQNAESKNQMKKYRALLKYKKDLQRQYQRIRYNHRVGRDLMPNSTTGVYRPGGD